MAHALHFKNFSQKLSDSFRDYIYLYFKQEQYKLIYTVH